VEFSDQPTPPVAPISHRRVARGKPNLTPEMSSSELPRLGYNESDAVVAISEQILVAKRGNPD
jgi:hypothetical protein